MQEIKQISNENNIATRVYNFAVSLPKGGKNKPRMKNYVTKSKSNNYATGITEDKFFLNSSK